MIDMNKVKTIIEFYLETRKSEWGFSGKNIEKLPPENKPAYQKIFYLYDLVEEIEGCNSNPNAKEELINLCEKIRGQEKIERTNHRSNLIPLGEKVFDYPLMAQTLKAIRSLIYQTAFENLIANTSPQQLSKDIRSLEEAAGKNEKSKELEEKIQGKKKALEIIELANFHKSDKKHDYLYIIKYEDYYNGDKSLQSIKEIDDFFNHYNKKGKPYLLLERLTELCKEEKKAKDAERKAPAPTMFALLKKAEIPLSKKENQIAQKSVSSPAFKK